MDERHEENAVPAQPAPGEQAAPAQDSPQQATVAGPGPVPGDPAAATPQPDQPAPIPPAPQPDQPAPVPPANPEPEVNPWNGSPQDASQVPPVQPTQQMPPAYQPAPQQTQAAPGYQAPQQGAPAYPQNQNGFAPIPPKKNNTPVIIAVIAAVVVIVLLVVFVVMPQFAQQPTITSTPPAATEPADEPSSPSTGGTGEYSDEERAAADVATERLELLANADPSMLTFIGDMVNEGFTSQMDGITLGDCGVDPTEYASIMLDGLTYEIDSVYVSDASGTAIVNVTVDCHDVFDMIDEFNAMLEAYTSSDEYNYTTAEEDMQRVGTMFLEAARVSDMNGGYDFAIDLERDGDTWVIDEESWEAEMDFLFDVE